MSRGMVPLRLLIRLNLIPECDFWMDSYIILTRPGERTSELISVQKSHSFVQNVARDLLNGFCNIASGGPVMTNGTVPAKPMQGAVDSRNGNWTESPGFGVMASPSNVLCGIRPGSSAAAFDVTQYNTSSVIPNGTGSGQLVYDPMVCSGIQIAGDNSYAYIDISRVFANSGVEDVTINELFVVGLYRDANCKLHCRDLLDTPVVLSPTQTFAATVRYKISL